MPRGGKPPGRPKKPPLTLEEALYVGTQCGKLQRRLIQWICNARARKAQQNAANALVHFRESVAELRGIPPHLRPYVDPPEDEGGNKAGVEPPCVPGIEDAQHTFFRAEAAKKALLDEMRKPVIIDVPEFPKEWRERIIRRVQERARREFGRHFSKNEIAACWALIRAAEAAD
jgi:hypothetical protein